MINIQKHRDTIFKNHKSIAGAATKMTNNKTPLQGAINALLNYQQADEDGIMVLTSRQAIHEVATAAQAYADLPSKIKGMKVNVAPGLHDQHIIAKINRAYESGRNQAIDDILKLLEETNEQ